MSVAAMQAVPVWPEQDLVQQFVAQASDERLGEGILHRLVPRRDIMPSDRMIVGRFAGWHAGQLRAVVSEAALGANQAWRCGAKRPGAGQACCAGSMSLTSFQMRVRVR